jgi:hypothetical protein
MADEEKVHVTDDMSVSDGSQEEETESDEAGSDDDDDDDASSSGHESDDTSEMSFDIALRQVARQLRQNTASSKMEIERT